MGSSALFRARSKPRCEPTPSHVRSATGTCRNTPSRGDRRRAGPGGPAPRAPSQPRPAQQRPPVSQEEKGRGLRRLLLPPVAGVGCRVSQSWRPILTQPPMTRSARFRLAGGRVARGSLPPPPHPRPPLSSRQAEESRPGRGVRAVAVFLLFRWRRWGRGAVGQGAAAAPRGGEERGWRKGSAGTPASGGSARPLCLQRPSRAPVARSRLPLARPRGDSPLLPPPRGAAALPSACPRRLGRLPPSRPGARRHPSVLAGGGAKELFAGGMGGCPAAGPGPPAGAVTFCRSAAAGSGGACQSPGGGRGRWGGGGRRRGATARSVSGRRYPRLGTEAGRTERKV